MNQLTQRDHILSALQTGYRLTPLTALRRFGCMRLGARIYELKRQGNPISKRMVKTSSGAMVAEYWMSSK